MTTTCEPTGPLPDAELARMWGLLRADNRDDLCLRDYRLLLGEIDRLRAILDAPQTALFADGRKPTDNERHLLNLLSWRQREAKDAKEALAVADEQIRVASDRAQSWKNLCEKFKEQAEARGEALDRQRPGRCRLCGMETRVIVGIHLAKANVCDSCCLAVTKQVVGGLVWERRDDGRTRIVGADQP